MVKEINTEDFKKLVFDFKNEKEWVFLGDKPAILQFSALWCGPCKQITPIVEDLSNEYEDKIDIYKIDVDNNPELSSAFSIRSIPSILFIPMDGQPQLMVGGLPKEKFKQGIKEILQIE